MRCLYEKGHARTTARDIASAAGAVFQALIAGLADQWLVDPDSPPQPLRSPSSHYLD